MWKCYEIKVDDKKATKYSRKKTLYFLDRCLSKGMTLHSELNWSYVVDVCPQAVSGNLSASGLLRVLFGEQGIGLKVILWV